MNHTIPGTPETLDIAKSQARRLTSALKGTTPLGHSQCLELISKIHGFESWGHLRSALSLKEKRSVDTPSPSSGSPIRYDRVLFESSYTREIVALFKFWKERSTGEILSSQQARHLGDILAKVEGNSIRMMFDQNCLFRNLTLGQLLEAEKKMASWDTCETARVSIAKLASYLPKDPYTFTIDDPHALTENDVLIDQKGVFTQTRDHKAGEKLGRDVFDRKHSIVLGGNISMLEETHENFVNLSQDGWVHPKSLADDLRLSCPQSGFGNGFSALNWLLSMYMHLNSGLIGMRNLGRNSREPRPVIVKISDIELGIGTPELVLSLARSFGFHIFLWFDCGKVSKSTWLRVRDSVDSILDCRNSEVITVHRAKQ